MRRLAILAGLVYALITLNVRVTPLLGAIGISGLAIAFAAQSILENTFASLLLRTRRPFTRGTQVRLGDYAGTVEEVNFRTVVVRTFDGERVLIPCSEVVDNPIVNLTARGMRRTTLAVGVAYGSDLDQAQATFLGAMSGTEGVLSHPAPEALVEAFGESSIDFALRYWHRAEEATLWRTRSAVALAVKRALDETGIEIPFPQRVLTVATPLRSGDGEMADEAADSVSPRPPDQ